jgi:hypothetical protein
LQNAEFVFRMEDVLDVFQRPQDEKRPLVCLDEASKQLLSDERPALPMAAGQPTRQDSEYRRNGTASLFMVYEPLLGKRRVHVTDRRTCQDFARVVAHLVDVLEVHYTPRHGQCLSERMGDRESLQSQVAAWQEGRDASAIKTDWRFTTKDARIRLKKLYPTILPG